MRDTTITKNKSLSLKFIASIFIILTHIFKKSEQIDNLKYISIFKIGKYPIEQYVGSFAGICVGMFIFLSGYGLYLSYDGSLNYRDILKRIFKIYINYWVILLIFFPIGMYMGVYEFEIKEFIQNIFALNTSYNHPAWFLRLYTMLLLIYPILQKLICIYNKKLIVIVSLVLSILGMGMTKLYYMIGNEIIVIDLISILLGGQFMFVLGIIIAKYSLFDKVRNSIGYKKIIWGILLILVITLIMISIDIPVIGEVSKSILIPVFILVLSNIINDKSIISKLGKHSTNIWLMHAFFYDYLFSEYIFSAKVSVLIVLKLVIILIIFSYIINHIINIINIKLICKPNKSSNCTGV